MSICLEKEDGVPWPGLQVINQNFNNNYKKALPIEWRPDFTLDML